MKKQLLICLTVLMVLILNNNIIYSKNNSSEEQDIKIEVKDVEIINSTINLDKMYETYAIITMDISNISLDCIELSNINYNAYQGDKKLQTFIQTKNKYLGFIGELKSGESKEIKVGVTLEEKNTPLKLVFENWDNIKRGKITKVINI